MEEDNLLLEDHNSKLLKVSDSTRGLRASVLRGVLTIS